MEAPGHSSPSTTGQVPSIAIIGGGFGGLATAYQLQKHCSMPFQATIYEAEGRLGGKLQTKHFGPGRVRYEAGAAELYDYSGVGEDPLRKLVDEFHLPVRGINGAAVIMRDQVLNGITDIRRHLGEATALAVDAFVSRARRYISPLDFFESDWKDAEGDGDGLLASTFHSLLAEVPDAAAREYIRTLVHSDLATEPHQTSARYGLQNVLMNDPAYMQLYIIGGGLERLAEKLASRITARVLLDEPVVRVGRGADSGLLVTSGRNARMTSVEFDYVVVALPNDAIPRVRWEGDQLADAMHRHHAHYDYPAHYVRVTMLFRTPFWRDRVVGSYFMLDAFDGCCLYDESSRDGDDSAGVLGWLIAGDAAMAMANLPDDVLVRRVLEALPEFLREGGEGLLDTRVHRWVGGVNGMPGGRPIRHVDTRHMPEPVEHSDLYVVGDYLFDSTLNGVLDSADYVAESLAEDLMEDALAGAAVSMVSQ